MNRIVIDNRHKIDTACQLVFSQLGRYDAAVDTFRAEKLRIKPLPYIEQEKEKMVNKAAAALAQSANQSYAEIHAQLEIIGVAAGEMENLLDLGEDLQNALSVVKHLSKELPSDIRFSLVEQFKGQKKALEILKSAYEASGIDSQPYFKGLIFDTDSYIEKLDSSAYTISIQPEAGMLKVSAFAKEIETFADLMGVELSKKASDWYDTSKYYEAELRAAFGVGSND